MDFGNIDSGIDDIQKVSGPLIDDNYLDDEDIPIDEDDELDDIEEEIGGFKRMKTNAPEDEIEEEVEEEGPLLRKKTTFVRLNSGEIDEDIEEEDEAGHGFKRMQTNAPEDDIEEDVDDLGDGPELKRKRTSFIRLDGDDPIDEDIDEMEEESKKELKRMKTNAPEDDIEEEDFGEAPGLNKN